VLLGVIGAGTLSCAAFLFMYAPGSGPEWPVIAGVVAMLSLGEVLIRRAELRRRELPAPTGI